jgi:hypothetical protein
VLYRSRNLADGADSAQKFEKLQPIIIVDKNLSLPIASRHHMVNGAWVSESWGSWHGGTNSKPRANRGCTVFLDKRCGGLSAIAESSSFSRGR